MYRDRLRVCVGKVEELDAVSSLVESSQYRCSLLEVGSNLPHFALVPVAVCSFLELLHPVYEGTEMPRV